jgi:ubiquinone/menaquinone biosynthesis C-methylase UbiE
MATEQANYSLREDVRAYWSERSKTFDLSFGHRIEVGPEFNAWAEVISAAIGQRPQRVLELACGTGEVTAVLLALGHTVTALDFAEPMLERARTKHASNRRAAFRLADAEMTMEPDNQYDAVVCRHLVWTLLDPARALADWLRVLKPGGSLFIMDGNWSQPTRLGAWAQRAIAVLDRFNPPARVVSEEMSARHAEIVTGLPFRDGLTYGQLSALVSGAGFGDVARMSLRPVQSAQRRVGTLRDALTTLRNEQFILRAIKPAL